MDRDPIQSDCRAAKRLNRRAGGGKENNMRVTSALACLAVTFGIGALLSRPAVRAEEQTTTLSDTGTKVFNRQMAPLTDGSRKGLQLDERDGDGLAWWPGTMLADGVIELEVRGKDLMQKSFVGVAFHGQDEKTFDAIYFRPFNFKSDDPVRRSHGVQYVSHPTYTWDKLRAERPNQFEHEVSTPPDPNEWFHARVVIKHPSVRVFVNDQTAPCLEVTQLSDRKRGWVGVWVGNGSAGSFANVKVTPAQ
jgi:hypothetical protein